jgi:Flp pilus assembly protein TadG
VIGLGLAIVKAALGLWPGSWHRRETGAVSPVFALMLVPLVGGLGMAAEATNWYMTHRAMQNAADGAAVAAATNGTINEATKCATAGDFCYEAKAAAARNGFVNGTGNVTVTADYLTTGCPGTVKSCYSVSITKKLPLTLLQIAGFTGDTTVGSARAQTVVASSIARAPVPVGYCSMALGTGNSFTINGGPNVNLAGCDLWSNGNLRCNGANSDTGVSYGGAAGTSSCGATQVGGQATKTDPMSGLSANIPANTCTSYPQNVGSAIVAPNIITSSTSFASPLKLCGNVRLGTNVNITTSGAEIVVYNGSLDLYGLKLSTSGSGSVTVIFSGTVLNGGPVTYTQIPVDTVHGGVIDIAAPTSGTFKGVAIMQDSSLTGNRNGVDMVYAGNNPTLDIQGLLYLPNSNFDIHGAINLHSSGLRCIGVIAKTVTVGGNGSIFDNTGVGVTADCAAAGLSLPTATVVRLALVQ